VLVFLSVFSEGKLFEVMFYGGERCIYMSLNIRQGYPDDLDSLVLTEKKCFSFPCAYSKNHLRYLLTKANSTVLVENQGGVLRGFIIVLYNDDMPGAGIETLNVAPEYRGKGIGHGLLTAAEEEAKNRGQPIITLEVSSKNITAIRLYEKCGFSAREYLPRYYQFPHQGTRDAIRMAKILT